MELFRHATVECVISISVMLNSSSLLVTEAVIELAPPPAPDADVAAAAAAATAIAVDRVSGVWSGGRESA